MKTTKAFLFAGLMVPTLAMALDAQEKSAIQVNLAKQYSQKDNGVVVRPVDKKYIEDSVTKLKGNATIEFGKAGSMKIKSGGVVIGSGADGLVATSNRSSGGPIVVPAPITPKTSITVVGRSGAGQKNVFCAQKIALFSDGAIIRAGTISLDFRTVTAPYSKDGQNYCAILGTPLRVSEGKYFVHFSNSISLVKVAAGENKIVPLREVSIPHYDEKISYVAFRDSSSTSETEKVACYLLASKQLEMWSFGSSVREATEVLSSSRNIEDRRVMENYAFLGSKVGAGIGGNFISVLPGVYAILWTIDNQNDWKRNIHVE